MLVSVTYENGIKALLNLDLVEGIEPLENGHCQIKVLHRDKFVRTIQGIDYFENFVTFPKTTLSEFGCSPIVKNNANLSDYVLAEQKTMDKVKLPVIELEVKPKREAWNKGVKGSTNKKTENVPTPTLSAPPVAVE